MRPGDRFDVGDDRERRPIPVDRLDTEGPLARKWGSIGPGASQIGCLTQIGTLALRAILGPYLRIIRSDLAPPWKAVLLIALGAVYALILAALAAAPMPVDPRLAR